MKPDIILREQLKNHINKILTEEVIDSLYLSVELIIEDFLAEWEEGEDGLAFWGRGYQSGAEDHGCNSKCEFCYSKKEI